MSDFSNAYNHAQQFGIPTYTEIDFTYVGAGVAVDDNIATATYKNAQGTVLGVLTYVYYGVTNNPKTITRTT